MRAIITITMSLLFLTSIVSYARPSGSAFYRYQTLLIKLKYHTDKIQLEFNDIKKVTRGEKQFFEGLPRRGRNYYVVLPCNCQHSKLVKNKVNQVYAKVKVNQQRLLSLQTQLRKHLQRFYQQSKMMGYITRSQKDTRLEKVSLKAMQNYVQYALKPFAADIKKTYVLDRCQYRPKKMPLVVLHIDKDKWRR